VAIAPRLPSCRPRPSRWPASTSHPIGRCEAAHVEDAIVLDDPVGANYRKLIIADGRIVGSILLGAGSSVTTTVRSAIAHRQDVRDCLKDLRAGRWEALK